MNPMKRKLLSLMLCAALLCACLPALAEGGDVTVIDMTGREITLEGPAERIVALTAADCEILYALGAGDRLVGRGEYCDYPAEVLEKPVVKSGAETNLEEILALEPQVVLMGTMAQTKEQVEAIERSGVKVIVSEATDVEGVYQAIAIIGAVAGRNDEADALIRQMQDTFAGISAQAVDTGRTVYFEISELAYGLWTAGSGTFMDDLGRMCGLTNAFQDLQGWQGISEESVLARDPDFIITTSAYSYATGQGGVEEIQGRPGWDVLKAVQNGRVFAVDYDAITRPGPRLMDAVKELFDFVSMPDAQAQPAA